MQGNKQFSKQEKQTPRYIIQFFLSGIHSVIPNKFSLTSQKQQFSQKNS